MARAALEEARAALAEALAARDLVRRRVSRALLGRPEPRPDDDPQVGGGGRPRAARRSGCRCSHRCAVSCAPRGAAELPRCRAAALPC